ncbi:MAG: thrombospondin type 3 repeat-containing protein [Ignavibacteria bacterium]
MKKIFLHLLFFLILLTPQQIKSQVKDKKIIHPLMGTLSLSLSSGVTFPFTDYNKSKVGFIWRGMAGYYFSTYSNQFVAIKVFGGTGILKGYDTNNYNSEFNTSILFIGGGVNYGYCIGEKLFPSLFAGLSYLQINPEIRNTTNLPNNESGVSFNDDVNLNFEFGLQYLITEKITVDINTGITLNFNDWLDASIRGNNNDIYYTLMLGISYYLSADIDSDKDGIANSRDVCPNTPVNVNVDDFGCPVDSDHDKIPDYLDLCPDTPARVEVDLNGCPLDKDKDGVPDFRDRCNNTPLGIRVNYFGCPIDSDHDGIPDYLDKCPMTPQGITVDSQGCPIDINGD